MDPKISSLEKFTIVFLLSKKPMHGYELMQQLKDCLKIKSSAGKIYPFLALLQKKKLLQVKILGNRGKKVYFLTAKGKIFMRELSEKFAPIFESSLGERIKVCVHCGCKV
ncbi:MAG: PadR family transcriptional regulator, partial [Candidatus Diapherotrites archaeon]|nr:PadR family transcriptional regulator [Candidatus Diapherotrites archaeon]